MPEAELEGAAEGAEREPEADEGGRTTVLPAEAAGGEREGDGEAQPGTEQPRKRRRLRRRQAEAAD